MITKKMPKQNSEKTEFDSQNPIIYDNTAREVIFVMRDTLDNKLRDFEECTKNKGSIFHDLGLIVAFTGTLVTVSEFKNFLTISGNVWQAVFLFFLILSVLKFLKDLTSIAFIKSIKREDILKQLLDESKRKK